MRRSGFKQASCKRTRIQPNYRPTKWLITRCKVVLHKLIVAQLFKKFHALYGTWRLSHLSTKALSTTVLKTTSTVNYIIRNSIHDCSLISSITTTLTSLSPLPPPFQTVQTARCMFLDDNGILLTGMGKVFICSATTRPTLEPNDTRIERCYTEWTGETY
jgi:hypothetical protein